MHSSPPVVSRSPDGPFPDPLVDDLDYAPESGGRKKNRNPLPRRLLAVLLRFKWLVPVPIVLGVGLGVLASRRVSPEYTARSTLWIGPSEARGGSPLQSGGMLQQQN